jgi:hypothetical protein
VARGLAYDTRRGWDRVAYCLLVNHLAEVAAAIADRSPTPAACERELWRQARNVLTEAAAEYGWPPELRAVLAGVPLPAKANLRVRWARDPDRAAGYVQVPNPCTPKDVLARRVRVGRLRALRVGDLLAFGLAGAYAWNISHHGFLMHPPPAFHYLP